MRYLAENIKKDLEEKMVFLGGPRQIGKTTLALDLLKKRKLSQERYFNWDFDQDREKILAGQWPIQSGLIVLDEIHKYKKWRNLVKGLYDKRRTDLSILVTGSARLDLYRHGGDSLQGRYHYYTLHPLTVAELKIDNTKDLETLINLSGFPEPFYSGDLEKKNRWSLEYRSRLVREDLRDLEKISEITLVELLAKRLPALVGSPLSLNSLHEDLQVSQPTVKRWCDILERMYYIYRIYPFGSAKIRAIKKASKHYHYDWSLPEDPGARLENFVAGHLIKWCDFLRDTKGRELEIRYFRDLDGREVDFVVLDKDKPVHFIECKTESKSISKALIYLKNKFPEVRATQISLKSKQSFKSEQGIESMSVLEFLRTLI